MPAELILTELSPTCRACGADLEVAFEIQVLGDTQATFHRCVRCNSMMVVDPYWLERSYATVLYPDPDSGALRRTLFVHRVLRRLRAVGLLKAKYRSLDYGSGSGMLVSLQQDRKALAVGYDRYATPRFAQLSCSKALPEGLFDLITAIEVAEHLTNPIEVFTTLREKLSPSGLVVVSTELYERHRCPDPSQWHYLAREHGQHITLFTQEGLSAASKSAGLRYIRTIKWGSTPFLHLLVHEARSTPSIRLGLLAWQQLWGELRESVDVGI